VDIDIVAMVGLYTSFYRPDLVVKSLNGKNISNYAKKRDIQKILSKY
jgi:hypothetical protein